MGRGHTRVRGALRACSGRASRRRELAGAWGERAGARTRSTSSVARGATCSTSTATNTSTWSWASGRSILGHDHPAVAGAVAEQASRGSVFATCTPLEVEVAERILLDGRLGGPGPLHELGHRVDDARPAPGARVHGQAQDPQVRGSLPRQPRPGARQRHAAALGGRLGRGPGAHPQRVAASRPSITRRRSWPSGTTSRRSSESIRRHRDELAAVIVEPVMANKGYIGPEPGYLEALRRHHARERRPADHG